MTSFRPVMLLVCLLATGTAAAQEGATIWQGLSQAAFDAAKTANVKTLTLERDRIRITLEDGTIQFSRPVGGLVYGAAFAGHGRLQVPPQNAREAQQLHLFTKQDELSLEFTEATFSFSDNTFEDVSRNVQWTTSPDDRLASLYARRQREREDIGAEILPRLFQGILSADHARTALFVAELNTREKGWVLARFDALDPEEVSVGRWGDYGIFRRFDTWMSFPAGNRSPSEADADPLGKSVFRVLSYQIETTVTAHADLSGVARARLGQRVEGERVLLFTLDSNLRVESVKDDKGTPLAFFQARERKDRPNSYGEYVAVVLPAPTQAGQVQTLEFRYGGKRAIRQVGPGSYFCESSGWYPEPFDRHAFASREDFELTFRVPKKFTLAATGNKTGETHEGDWTVTTWKSPVPLAVAGFAFGEYKTYSTKAGSIQVDSYASREPDDLMSRLQQYFENPLGHLTGQSGPAAAVGTLNPSALTKTVAVEVANTLNVFQIYFGPLPYDHLSVTTIPYSYGQSWPMLLYLDEVSYLDSTQRHALGIQDHIEITDFFRAHEASHQWWGHRVGWKSYHDQWLSEGFAQFSGNLYTQYRENMKEYLNRLRQDRRDLLADDRHGHTYESVGPVWMGHRLSSSESPGAYNVVVYNKGGYVLHMLRMLLFDPRSRDPEVSFKAMMQDFTSTYENKPASTEDFKAIAEKHMTPAMDLDGNHRLDWFFNQYVYGTGVPHYNFAYRVESAGGDQWKISGTVERSGGPDNWKDLLPLYIHAPGGKLLRIGSIRATARMAPFEFTLPFKPEKLSLNDFEDILADIRQ